MLHYLWFAIVGFFIGLIARAILPGADQYGILMTTIIGIAGSFIGGFVGGLIKKPEEGAKFHPAGFIMSIIGAIILLYCLRLIHH